MRNFLTTVYRVSGALAGASLVAICAVVTAQVVGNIIDRVLIVTIGRPIGIVIPAYSDFAGFLLASSTFLALAHTLMKGEHIRVRLLLSRLPPRARRWAELWCSGFGVAVAATATYFAVLLMLESGQFGDVMSGMVALPLWIPQSVMALGLAVFTTALLDTFFTVLTGGHPLHEKDEVEMAIHGEAP
jgi:TRAP-type C4-dicarboxylate transport system permease small subunit